MPSSEIVPPAPHVFLSRVTSAGRSLSAGLRPRITVIMRPCLRFSTETRALCFPGASRTGSGGGHVHSDSGFSQRSQCGGRSKIVPASRPINHRECGGKVSAAVRDPCSQSINATPGPSIRAKYQGRVIVSLRFMITRATPVHEARSILSRVAGASYSPTVRNSSAATESAVNAAR
jgi:hypothetical protein